MQWVGMGKLVPSHFLADTRHHLQALELLRVLLNIDVLDGPVLKNSFLEMFYNPTGHMERLLTTLSARGGANVVSITNHTPRSSQG